MFLLDVTFKNPTIQGLLVVLDHSPLTFSINNLNFQAILLAANRWARLQKDENNDFFRGAYWSGEMSESNGVYRMGVVCIKKNIADIINLSGISPEPNNREVWLKSNEIVRVEVISLAFGMEKNG